MMFRKVKQAPTYVEQTHPTDCLWIYMKAVYTYYTIHIYIQGVPRVKVTNSGECSLG